MPARSVLLPALLLLCQAPQHEVPLYVLILQPADQAVVEHLHICGSKFAVFAESFQLGDEISHRLPLLL